MFDPMSRCHFACNGLTTLKEVSTAEADLDVLGGGFSFISKRRSGSGPRGPKSGPVDNDNAVPGFGPRRC